MESEVSLDSMASEFLNSFGYGMDAVDFINFLIGESPDGIHRLFLAENSQGHEFIYSKMMGMLSTKSAPTDIYKVFHNIFDPEIPIGEFGILTVQSMPFFDAQTTDLSESHPYDMRVYLITHHAISMYDAEGAEEFMAEMLDDPNATFKDAWEYKGFKKNSLRYIDFS